jgi:asparagine synthase (glutamine-hydrolysing)
VAEQYHTDHHEYTVHENVKDNLKKIVSYFDEPFGDPSLVPTYFVSQLARQKVTVAIAGDGGDEVFAGYEKYSTDHIENKLRNAIPTFIRKSLFPIMETLFSKFDFKIARKATTLLNNLQQSPAMGFYQTNAQITDKIWAEITSAKTRETLGSYHPSTITTNFYEQCDGTDHLAKILYTDIKTYLPGGILVKVDRMSMANSLEVRAPILDYQLMEFSATVPSSLKFNQGEKKYLLKEAFKDDLPDDILYRKKMGFSVPLAQWLREELKELTQTTLFQSAGGVPDYFNMINIQKLWDQHQQGQKDNATVLWSLLMFQLWWDEYMGEAKQAA